MRWRQRFLRRALTEKHLDAELRFHLEHRIADLVGAGMAYEEARRRARLEFGGLDQVKEECRDVGTTHFLEILIQDLRYGLRQLRRLEQEEELKPSRADWSSTREIGRGQV
jgi:hypothetical protein